MKTRKGGFTLVELLIVIMIIAILAGMMMLATGSATDSAEATRIINDLRNLKSAALLFYGDNLRWPSSTNTTDVTSLDGYADRSFTANTGRYSTVAIGAEYTESATGARRARIGLGLGGDITAGAKEKLASKASEIGLFGDPTREAAVYTTTDTAIYMNMR